MKTRHPSYWCRTTLHYRGWSYREITTILGNPDVQEIGSYYEIPRVLAGEARRRKIRAVNAKLFALLGSGLDPVQVSACGSVAAHFRTVPLSNNQ